MINALLLQAQQGGGYTQMIFLVGIVAVFWLFIIRPQQKKQKEQKKFIENISKGDEVVTIGGIHGKVHTVNADTVIVEVDKGVKLTLNKSALSAESTTPAKK